MQNARQIAQGVLPYNSRAVLLCACAVVQRVYIYAKIIDHAGSSHGWELIRGTALATGYKLDSIGDSVALPTALRARWDMY